MQGNRVEIAVFGAGGFAREVEWLIAEKNVHSPMATVCFVGRGDEVGSEIHGVPVLSAPEAHKRFPNAYVICTSGSGAIREAMAQEATTAGFTNYATLIDPGTPSSARSLKFQGYVVLPKPIIDLGVVVPAVVRDQPFDEPIVGGQGLDHS